MKVKIIKTDWFLNRDPQEGTISFETENGCVLDAFSYGEDFTEGEIVDADITALDYDLDWKIIFGENSRKEKKLVRDGNDWSYIGYGEIIFVAPVKIDFGSIVLDTGYWTNDPTVIGDYVYWKIERLDISNSSEMRLT